MAKDKSILFLIVLTAIVVRVLFIWIGRPEFVGWFNHTYYYYVEVKGLLENGTLPYPDMPLLFYIYAFTAKILIWIGIDLNTAIVTSTRFWMCVIPSLIPIPIYLTIRSINHQNQPNNKWFWVLVAASAFLPLSISYMPEFLQKNVLGMVILVTIMFLSKTILTSFKTKNFIALLAVFILIVFTHYGSAGVAILYGVSVLIAYFFHSKKKKITIFGSIISLSSLFAIGIIYLIDIQRFERILFYLKESFGASFIASLFSAESDLNERVSALAGILVPVLIVMLFYKLFRKNRAQISEENKLFWLSNIIFFYLLILPVYDQLLMGRLALYLSLPLLFNLVFIIKYAITKAWLKNAVLALIVFGVLFMAFGEFMSLKFHNRDKEDIFADLMKMKKQTSFQPNDLIITKNGAEHICNWFLNTKSGVITSLNLIDFKKYGRVYILNPIEGRLNFEGIENKNTTNEQDKYLFMLRNIPKPKDAIVVYKSEYIQLLFLESAPDEWKFDHSGTWTSYKK